eukprot:4384953-Amphidinium_carterae.1
MEKEAVKNKNRSRKVPYIFLWFCGFRRVLKMQACPFLKACDGSCCAGDREMRRPTRLESIFASKSTVAREQGPEVMPRLPHPTDFC